jgi:DNA-binding transcriptional MerR regulator
MQMSSAKLLTIGQFSALCLLSVRTLRHYDALGLLMPAFVDRGSGYRYYSASQVNEARRIRLYRSWDLSLGEIGELLNQRDTEAIFSAIKRHRSRVEKRIAEYKTVIAAIDRELRSENQKIAVKVSPVQAIVSVMIGNPSVQVDSTVLAIASLSKLARKSNAHVNGHPFAICHNSGDKARQAWEICLPVESRVETAGEIVAKKVGSTSVAYTMHRGDLGKLDYTHKRLADWIQSHGYFAVGPLRETYLGGCDRYRKPRHCLIEIGWPVSSKPSLDGRKPQIPTCI